MTRYFNLLTLHVRDQVTSWAGGEGALEMPVGLWMCPIVPEVTAGLALSLLPQWTQTCHLSMLCHPCSGSWMLHVTEVSLDPFSSPSNLHATSFPLCCCLPHLLSFQHFPAPSLPVFCSRITPTNYTYVLLLSATTSFLASSLKKPLLEMHHPAALDLKSTH